MNTMQHIQQQTALVLTVLTVAIVGPSGWILAHLDHYKSRGWCSWDSSSNVKINLFLINLNFTLFMIGFVLFFLSDRCSSDTHHQVSGALRGGGTTTSFMNNFLWLGQHLLSVFEGTMDPQLTGTGNQTPALSLQKHLIAPLHSELKRRQRKEETECLDSNGKTVGSFLLNAGGMETRNGWWYRAKVSSLSHIWLKREKKMSVLY